MTKQEMTTLLRSICVDERTVTVMQSAYEMGYAHGQYDKRAAMMQLFLDPENQPTQFGTATQEYRAKEIKEEREACAKLAQETICDTHIPTGVHIYDTRAAKAIRARGEPTSRGEA